LDGIQGPVYAGSGCCFNRKALYGFDPAVADDADDLETGGLRKWCCFGARGRRKLRLKRTMSVVPLLESEDDDEETERAKRRRLRSYQSALERHFGLSPAFIASAFGEHGSQSQQPAAMAACPLLKDAIINVVSSAYEERTRWGKEVPVVSCSCCRVTPACSGDSTI
jgi:cellulose synthase A